MEERKNVALVLAQATPSRDTYTFEVAGLADSAGSFAAQSASDGIRLAREALGPLLEVPLLPSQAAADLLGKLRRGVPFPFGCGRWRCFPVAEFHETNDRALWEGATEGRPLWKGESFDHYNPHGGEARPCPVSTEAVEKQRRDKPRDRPGKDSLLAAEIGVAERKLAQRAEIGRARAVFRDVTRENDARSVRACLVPPNIFLVNSAPYLVFVGGSDLDRACCLGFLNSLAFDWQARRFVEQHVNYFILEGLRLPELTDEQYERIARAAARLSCPDERFDEFAAATGVEVGPLSADERDALRVEIDARAAHAWSLDAEDLETIFSDFTLDAVPESYRQLVRNRFAELAAAEGQRSVVA
jgi:hypothetical protein